MADIVNIDHNATCLPPPPLPQVLHNHTQQKLEIMVIQFFLEGGG